MENQEQRRDENRDQAQDPTVAAVTGVIEDAFGSGASTRDSVHSQSNRQDEREEYLELDTNRTGNQEPGAVGGSGQGDLMQEGPSIDGPAYRPQPMHSGPGQA